MRFTAVEEFAVERIGFAWQARFPLIPLVAMKVVDEYADGNGQLVARLLGIPVMRQRGPETAVGEALRYLAELPWVPQAIAVNRELRWRELDGREIEVATTVAGQQVAVRFEFDASGDIVRASTDARPRPVGKTFVATPGAARSVATRLLLRRGFRPGQRLGGTCPRAHSSIGAAELRRSSRSRPPRPTIHKRERSRDV
jgi:hypothetical protein